MRSWPAMQVSKYMKWIKYSMQNLKLLQFKLSLQNKHLDMKNETK
jgi:hypothetical protein